MSSVAVIANSAKTLDGGLPELRKVLEQRGVRNPQWREVEKSREAPEQLQRAVRDGAELIFIWGGDGMVQRCVDAVGDSKASIAILPAGTANLFASNLGIPRKIAAAVDIGLDGERRKFDVGRMNGERFAVMAGVGFDARVIRDATKKLKGRYGRSAYIWAASKNIRMSLFDARIDVDGSTWYEGDASVILFGNVGKAFAGLEVFDNARTDDGLLEVGVGNPEGILQWARIFARSKFSSVSKSPLVQLTKGRTIEVTLPRKERYELDGSGRPKKKTFKVEAEEAAVSICVPAKAV
jgi:diacylglycerol kinase (ATP)